MMKSRESIRCLALGAALILMLSMVAFAAAESGEAGFSFYGARWGMNKEEVRALMGIDPFQEPVDPDSGHSALAYYPVPMSGVSGLLQFAFLPEDLLYNIEIMIPPEENQDAYAALAADFTDQYGAPRTEAEADAEGNDAAAVMLALLMQSTSDTDFLAWQADDETVIVLSKDPNYHVVYVEMRRYTDYFRFAE